MHGAQSRKGSIVVGLICAAALLGATNANAASFSVPPGKALVYVMQGETGGFANLLVSVNGRQVGTVRANSWFAFAADPGVQLVSVAATASAATRLKVEAGKTYYLEQRVNAAGIPVFRAMPESQAQPLLARYRQARADLVIVGAPVATTPPKSVAKSQPPAKAAPRAAPAPVRASAPDTAPDAHFMLLAKLGVFKLSETSQSWFDMPATVDDGASGVFGFEFGYEFAQGWTVGAELFNFKNSWTQTDGSAGTFKTYVIAANGKKYFAVNDVVRPFVGLGLGLASTDFSGDISGGSDGVAFQIVGGVEFLFKHVGAYLEVKSLSADTEADRAGGGTDQVDVGGRGVFAGVSVHF